LTLIQEHLVEADVMDGYHQVPLGLDRVRWTGWLVGRRFSGGSRTLHCWSLARDWWSLASWTGRSAFQGSHPPLCGAWSTQWWAVPGRCHQNWDDARSGTWVARNWCSYPALKLFDQAGDASRRYAMARAASWPLSWGFLLVDGNYVLVARPWPCLWRSEVNAPGGIRLLRCSPGAGAFWLVDLRLSNRVGAQSSIDSHADRRCCRA